MARIRTIKPDFFTSEDIVGLTPAARLLYIALWCESDREGRMAWRPGTFKLRYFPGDQVDLEALSKELLDRRLVVLYGDGLAYIPTFLEHQHINPREAVSSLPVPDASLRVKHAQVGREGKGKEGERTRGTRLPADWKPDEDQVKFCRQERPDLHPETTASRFRDYWVAIAGAKGVKLDWNATWRNWVRNEKGAGGKPAPVARIAPPCGNCEKPLTGGWSQSPKGRVCEECHRGYMAGAWPERRAA